MECPPAMVIIARHGARLDAADTQWHLTSPTPYDPPLTYGGWLQSRALGVRIAALLQARESEVFEEEKDENTRQGPFASASSNGVEERRKSSPKTRRRQHRIIIHSSPFQRCIETSIAISAGLAQHQGRSNSPVMTSATRSAKSPSRLRRSPSASFRKSASSHPHLAAAIPESAADRSLPKHIQRGRNTKNKACLRIDAFLGEWLSPDYYESITPPPGSLMMLTCAKADVLRRESLNDTSDDYRRNDIIDAGHVPGGWAQQAEQMGKVRHAVAIDESPLSNLAELAQTLPPQDRANSFSSTTNHHRFRGISHVYDLNSKKSYVAPTPRYAISPQEPIPYGYVGHARDACLDVDYRWDSMSSSLDWGDGGEYGEEWSAMHHRFRHGLAQMIAWYSTPSATTSPVTSSPKAPPDFDTDTVLILVTHGAGCNALIGALTNQPVLLDVGMASLTLAVRKNTWAASPPTIPPAFSTARASSLDTGLSQLYTLRLTASTDHLRTISSPFPIPSSAIALPPARPRYTISHPLPLIMDSPLNGIIPSLSHSSASTPEGEQSTAPAGLWTLARRTAEVEDSKHAVDTDLGRVAHLSGNMRDEDSAAEEMRIHGQRGLWGAPDAVVAKEREEGPKRRWTVTEEAVVAVGLGA